MRRRRPAAAASFAPPALLLLALSAPYWLSPNPAADAVGEISVRDQCPGRNTVLEMMQSPSFNDVIGSCRGPLSLDITCKTCLNYGIVYLRRLIGSDDNVALSVCRSAVFVTLATQHGVLSYDDILTCFFGVQGITTFPGTVSVTSTPASTPNVTVPSDSSAPKTKSVPLPQKHQKPYHISVVPGIGIGVILLAILLQIVLVVLIRRKNKELRDAELSAQSPDNAFHQGQSWRCAEGQSPMFQRYSYKETTKATNNFSTVIGKGGFGTVYKAQFSDGSIAAVKRMDKVSRQAEEEFCREMELLARLHHRHLVNLKGFCVERKERFLVYEYMENGSLKDHLHSSGTKALSWQTRLQIAMDVANALEYLHFFCNPPLCHRDIKSSNILLDENFVAKVADFGLAHASRTGAISFEAVNTDIRGTPGYMDPEYVVTQELTEKSDIYSYGVVLLELVTGRRAIQDKKNLVEWAQEYMSPSGEIPPELVDPTIRDSTGSYKERYIVYGNFEVPYYITFRPYNSIPTNGSLRLRVAKLTFLLTYVASFGPELDMILLSDTVTKGGFQAFLRIADQAMGVSPSQVSSQKRVLAPLPITTFVLLSRDCLTFIRLFQKGESVGLTVTWDKDVV
uniref:Putative LRR receptor-like serine/threonine-protein kinase n=1 Tax=Aegilops tauschii TaxID=37682 RepID=M8BX06_AEGTA